MRPDIGSWAWDSQKRKSEKPARGGGEKLVGSRKWEETGGMGGKRGGRDRASLSDPCQQDWKHWTRRDVQMRG